MAKFYDHKEIFARGMKIYMSGRIFQESIVEGGLFPLQMRLKTLKETDLRDHYSTIQEELTRLKRENLELEYKVFSFKNIGLQTLPLSVRFTDRGSLLGYLSRGDEFEEFRSLYGKITTKYPQLGDLLYQKPFVVLEYAPIWERLMKVCDFFVAHPAPMIYIRELGIEGVDTKFVEQYKKILDTLLMTLLPYCPKREEITTLTNYGFERRYSLKYPLPIVRFRILDTSQRLHGLSDLSVTIEEFATLHLEATDVYIVENKITTLSFPPLPNTIVIFGNGYGVEILKGVAWLQEKNISYWGDIDTDGFAILSQARGYFPHIKSLFMDERTIERFAHYATHDNKPTKTQRSLPNLTQEEQRVYQKLRDGVYAESFRLEQEKIDFGYVVEGLTCVNLS